MAIKQGNKLTEVSGENSTLTSNAGEPQTKVSESKTINEQEAPSSIREDTVWTLMWRAIHQSVLFLGIFAILSLIGSYMFVGLSGVSAALMAIVTVVLFCLSNPVLVAVLSRLHLRPAAYMTWFMLGWIIKIAIVVVVLLLAQQIPGINLKLCGILIIVGAAIVLAAETHTALNSRVPYVRPEEVHQSAHSDTM
ncbi:hypothetical protein GCM10007377_08140 [Galliscardovia ingluviei]|uniref:Uncharacterized protein n=1 Tax=Galliscardovia ingluviei TaxID=1769422 RepID=A0A8J3AHG8_9BIFI|nr:hypothetical protein [Galliscardovia ingluviei]GGI13874.1 hypothetical protein GCM10007377_08140 [Galliscardovia ingluviei]